MGRYGWSGLVGERLWVATTVSLLVGPGSYLGQVTPGTPSVASRGLSGRRRTRT